MRAADQQVLDRVDAHPPQHLDRGDADEGEGDEEQAVLGGAVAQRVRAHRVDEGDAEGLDAAGARRAPTAARGGVSPKTQAGAPAAASCGAVVASALSFHRALKAGVADLRGRAAGSGRRTTDAASRTRASTLRRVADRREGELAGADDLERHLRRERPASSRRRRRRRRRESRADAAAWPVPGSTGAAAPSMRTAALRTPRESPRATKTLGASHCRREPACSALRHAAPRRRSRRRPASPS